jgi:hypothetical protein
VEDVRKADLGAQHSRFRVPGNLLFTGSPLGLLL